MACTRYRKSENWDRPLNDVRHRNRRSFDHFKQKKPRLLPRLGATFLESYASADYGLRITKCPTPVPQHLWLRFPSQVSLVSDPPFSMRR